MSEEIEVSKTGIKFSYHRFVADSAPGFILILIFLIFDKKYNLNIFPGEKETKVFVNILLFILATPLGLCINGISWFILSLAVDFCEKICLKYISVDKEYLLLNTLNFKDPDVIKKYFCYMSIFENIIEKKNFHSNIEHVHGVQQFFRSLALILMFLLLMPLIFPKKAIYIWMLISISLFCIFFAGVAKYCWEGEIFRKIYILYFTDKEVKDELERLISEENLRKFFNLKKSK